jgi:hypothetical protein
VRLGIGYLSLNHPGEVLRLGFVDVRASHDLELALCELEREGGLEAQLADLPQQGEVVVAWLLGVRMTT